MELISILKYQFNTFKKALIIFFAIIFVISLMMFIPFNDTVKYYIGAVTLLCSLAVTIFLSISLCGSFGKTYAFLHNNRKVYSLSLIIWNISLAIILTILFSIMKIALSSISFNFILVALFLFVTTFNLSYAYSLYFRYQKIFRSVLAVLILVAFLFLNKYVMGFIKNLTMEMLTEPSMNIAMFKLNTVSYLLVMIGVNVIINVLNLIYYSNFNIIKSLS